jgi:hypothetical protein
MSLAPEVKGRHMEALFVQLEQDPEEEISVHDGEEWPCKQTRNKSDVLLAVFSVDESSIKVRDNGQILGTIWVILDNGEDCIVDYSTALDQYM